MRQQLGAKEKFLDLKNIKLLLIEDDIELQAVMYTAFSRSNAQIYKTFNGQEGIRRFFTDRPDLVILDLVMPEMDGEEVCRRIRQFSDVPIIMLTPLNHEQDVIRNRYYGADAYVTKPVSPNALLTQVQAFL